jgi:exodeoxyribonuclease VII large subunit
VGALASAFEQLKEKLAAEGLFAPERKKPLPAWPETIGVIAAESGAAIQDVRSIVHRRCPLTRVILFPAVVQGATAPASLVRQLSEADNTADLDLIILARGGGSLEDLWAFNEEVVVRAVSGCRKPTVSAVGHEIDFTLTDFTADLRAATPSAAAELVVPDVVGVLEEMRKRMRLAVERKMDQWRQRLESARRHLELLNPTAILQRGYSITKKNGVPVRSVKEVQVGDRLETLLSDGSVFSEVVFDTPMKI